MFKPQEMTRNIFLYVLFFFTVYQLFILKLKNQIKLMIASCSAFFLFSFFFSIFILELW
jgi:hypothetical protein